VSHVLRGNTLLNSDLITLYHITSEGGKKINHKKQSTRTQAPFINRTLSVQMVKWNVKRHMYVWAVTGKPWTHDDKPCTNKSKNT